MVERLIRTLLWEWAYEYPYPTSAHRTRALARYQFQDEQNDLAFEQRVVGMANAGPGTNGSQFHLVLDAAPHLTGEYTAFGQIDEGIDVMLSLRRRDPASDPEPGDIINSVEILE